MLSNSNEKSRQQRFPSREDYYDEVFRSDTGPHLAHAPGALPRTALVGWSNWQGGVRNDWKYSAETLIMSGEQMARTCLRHTYHPPSA